jgi:hypothetical protein
MAVMVYRLLSTGFLIAGLILLGVSAVVWYLDATDGPGVTLAEPERTLEAVTAGEPVVVSFAITNPTRHPSRIVGLAEC